jgi:hypothetical protein
VSGRLLAPGVSQGISEKRTPGVLVAIGHGRPFPERAAGGRERLGLAAVDELVDASAGKVDDEVASAVVAGGEDVPLGSQAREAHQSTRVLPRGHCVW